MDMYINLRKKHNSDIESTTSVNPLIRVPDFRVGIFNLLTCIPEHFYS